MSKVTFDGRDPTPEDWKIYQHTLEHDPACWLAEALDLRYSATVLLNALKETKWPPVSSPVYFHRDGNSLICSILLLYGYSIECLIKGLLLAQYGIKPSSVGHAVGQSARTHNICTDQDIKFLSRLEKAVLWAGRYPVPMPKGSQEIELLFAKDSPARLKYSDPDEFERLFKKLAWSYPEKNRDHVWPHEYFKTQSNNTQ